MKTRFADTLLFSLIFLTYSGLNALAQAPVVSIQPASLTTNGGATVTFDSLVSGTGPFWYQWQFKGTNLDGATNSSLVLTNVLVVQSGTYSVTVSNASGFSPPTNASLTVVPWIRISISPTNVNYGAGTIISFKFDVGGFLPTSYQWTQDGNPVGGPGPNGPLMQLINPFLISAGVYNVTASDDTTTLTSSNVTLVINPLTITTSPTDATAWIGRTVRFGLSAIGVSPIVYQWQHAGVDIPGANTNFLALTNIQSDQLGQYIVLVTNAYTNISRTVTLFPSEVVVWGGNHGETNVFPGLTNIAAISATPSSSSSPACIALRSNGSAVTWQNSFPRQPTNLIAIAAGLTTHYGLTEDGQLIYWYYDGVGPTGLTNVVMITPGTDFALQADGNVVGSGVTVGGLSNIVAIAKGTSHYMALRANGTVAVWGNNLFGQTNVPANLSNVTAIAAATGQCVALKSDGTVVVWGGNLTTNVPASLSNVVSIAAGGGHVMALRANGTVVSWGTNNVGQTSVPANLTNVTAIAAGYDVSMAMVGNGPPVTQALISDTISSSNTVKMSIPSQSGRVYMLQYKDSILDASWTSAPLVPGNGGTLWLTDPNATNSQRFYRVLRW